MRQGRRRQHLKAPVQICLICLCCHLCGCGTLANGRGWGQDASLTPGWDRVARSARNAALATETWAPLAGAIVLQIGDADHKLQSWAATQTPVFGSQSNAAQKSDDLKLVSSALWLGSGLATPGGDDPETWVMNKARGLGVQAGAVIVLGETVGVLKDTTQRMRPNGQGTSSFPSDHASRTALYTTMTSKNIATLGWSDDALSATRFGLGTLTAATAWARVEANQHYPSDVLAGMALGHFMGAFFTDAFLGLEDQQRVQVLFEPSRDRFVMMVRFGL
jgi:membrane-associated phospholipid phosphatase